jgi:hypothetical protein
MPLSGPTEKRRSALEDWNMQESTLVAEWTAAARAEGRAEGFAEGLAEARAELFAQGQQRFLIQVLAERFNVPILPEVVHAIEAETDPEVLSGWLSHAISAPSLDAFRNATAAWTSVTLHLRPETERLLWEKASRREQTLEQYLERLADREAEADTDPPTPDRP